MEKPLSQEFLDSCRRDKGRIMRGENMTRIETFVDAAFAFAFTMLVISIDEIPNNVAQLIELSRDIPAFLASASMIGAIWLSHATWSRTFGLQDKVTIYLSLALVMLVLIFVYPIKLTFTATFFYFTDGALAGNIGEMQWNDVANLFIYFGIGLLALSLILIFLYQNTLRHAQHLRLNEYEKHYCVGNIKGWCVVATTAVVSAISASFLEGDAVPIAGFMYFSLFITVRLTAYYHTRQQPAPIE